MSLVFQGDPRLFLDKNGAYIAFSGGQPVMDRGFENVVLILLKNTSDQISKKRMTHRLRRNRLRVLKTRHKSRCKSCLIRV
jgi:hypothetical protein